MMELYIFLASLQMYDIWYRNNNGNKVLFQKMRKKIQGIMNYK